MKRFFTALFIISLGLNIFFIVKCYPQKTIETTINKNFMDNLYKDLLSEQNIDKFHDYFTKDCRIEINGETFNADQFKKRMKWLKENTKTIKIEVTNFFVSQDSRQLTDTHISDTIDIKNVHRKAFVVQQSTLENNKIKTFTMNGRIMEGDPNPKIITAK